MRGSRQLWNLWLRNLLDLQSMTMREGEKLRCGQTTKPVTTPSFGSLTVPVFKIMDLL